MTLHLTAEDSRALLGDFWPPDISEIMAHLRAALDREAAERARADEAEAHSNFISDGWAASVRAHATTLAERDAARAEVERLREALRFYDTHENWCIGGPLDGNSPNFTGGPAGAALASEPGA